MESQKNEVKLTLMRGRSILYEICDIIDTFDVSEIKELKSIDEGLNKLRNTSSYIIDLFITLGNYADDTNSDPLVIYRTFENILFSLSSMQSDFKRILDDISTMSHLKLNKKLEPSFKEIPNHLKEIIVKITKLCILQEVSYDEIHSTASELIDGLKLLNSDFRQILRALQMIKTYNTSKKKLSKLINHIVPKPHKNVLKNACQCVNHLQMEYKLQKKLILCKVEKTFLHAKDYIRNRYSSLLKIAGHFSNNYEEFNTKLSLYMETAKKVTASIAQTIHKFLEATKEQIQENFFQHSDDIESSLSDERVYLKLFNSTDIRTTYVCLNDNLPVMIKSDLEISLKYFSKENCNIYPKFLQKVLTEYDVNMYRLVGNVTKSLSLETMERALQDVSIVRRKKLQKGY